MKLSDFVISFLYENGIDCAFVVSGGACLHLLDSVENHPKMGLVCSQHEQAAAMSADGYSRISDKLGLAITTSGPGATNLLTGICSAYYDSIPVFYITGQVSTFRMKGSLGVRQLGFQETDNISIFKSVTNYCTLLKNPETIKFELEKALFYAKKGRPGPVLIDIPDDLQRVEIKPERLIGYNPSQSLNFNLEENNLLKKIKDCNKLIRSAKRPVLILGAGINLSFARKLAIELINFLQIPFAPTWALADILPTDHPLYIGTFGTHGTRHANFIVQNSDLILSIGSRLDTKSTGSPPSTFAREAKKIMIDIDHNEINKFDLLKMKIDIPIPYDAMFFIKTFLQYNKKKSPYKINNNWTNYIEQIKERFQDNYHKSIRADDINPYIFMKILSKMLAEETILVTDTGCLLAWLMQGFNLKKNQRILHDWNNTAMGWAIPASIGAYFSTKKPIVCLTGDGSLQMNIQELATIKRYNIPIKIILFNNHGYSMIRQTQEQWLNSKYVASSYEGGLPNINYAEVAKGYGLEVLSINQSNEVESQLKQFLNYSSSIFCEVEIDHRYRVLPQTKFGRPIEDSEPLLDRKDFRSNMIINEITL